MKGTDGSEIPPTGKSSRSTSTRSLWDDGQIVEENLVYDLVTFMNQIGVSDLRERVAVSDRSDTHEPPTSALSCRFGTRSGIAAIADSPSANGAAEAPP